MAGWSLTICSWLWIVVDHCLLVVAGYRLLWILVGCLGCSSLFVPM